MKILVLHNAYREFGGEDAVVRDEVQLLTQAGHDVQVFLRDNHEIDLQPVWRTAMETIWSRRSRQATTDLIDAFEPDVVHVHNTFALLSPSVLWAADRRGVPVVATLHNFRLACLAASFNRDGQPCEDCRGKVPWRGVIRACCRGSHLQSGVLAASTLSHRLLGSWRDRVQRFVVLNEWAVPFFVSAGLPAHRLKVRPNFSPTRPEIDLDRPRDGLLFVGRVTHDKGAGVLAAALVDSPGLALTVIGEGPAASLFKGTAARLLGAQPPEEVAAHMARATCLVLPSLAYEQFPRVIAEAFASGLPIIAADRGPLARLVIDGHTGLICQAGDPADLARKMHWAASNPVLMRQMGRNAIAFHASTLSPQASLDQLLGIYREARMERLSRGDR